MRFGSLRRETRAKWRERRQQQPQVEATSIAPPVDPAPTRALAAVVTCAKKLLRDSCRTGRRDSLFLDCEWSYCARNRMRRHPNALVFAMFVLLGVFFAKGIAIPLCFCGIGAGDGCSSCSACCSCPENGDKDDGALECEEHSQEFPGQGEGSSVQPTDPGCHCGMSSPPGQPLLAPAAARASSKSPTAYVPVKPLACWPSPHARALSRHHPLWRPPPRLDRTHPLRC